MPLILYLSNGYLCGMGLWLFAMGVVFVVCFKLRARRRRAGKSVGAIHAVLSVWMCLAMLTLLELFFALAYDQSDSFNMTNVSDRWLLRHVHKNKSDFRDVHVIDSAGKEWAKEFPIKDQFHRKRLVFAGDSFTFGHGVDGPLRFSDRLAATIERAHPREFDVHNVSGCGFGTPEVLKVLRQLLEEGTEIDVVVYSMVLNDIEYQADFTQVVNQRIKDSKPEFFLFRDTYFFNMVYFRTYQFRLPEIRNYFSFVKDYYVGEPWAKFEELLDELCDLCRAYNADLRIAIFPFLHNLGPDYPFGDQHAKLVAYFQKKKIRVLDLEPVLSQHVAEGLTVNRFDAHPNSRAHEIVADAIQTQLLEDLFQKSN